MVFDSCTRVYPSPVCVPSWCRRNPHIAGTKSQAAASGMKTERHIMSSHLRLAIKIVLSSVVLGCAVTSMAQQKAQWVPGQQGLNAGVLPEPGLTVANITINYSASTLNDSEGNTVPVTGDYDIWAVETGIFYVPSATVLGGKLSFSAILPAANGSATLPQFGVNAGGYGYADTWIQPFTLGWKKARADFSVGYGLTIPTGRYVNGATDNIGSGYWGHNVLSNWTVYLTKNKSTTADLATIWEIHSKKDGSNVTPGQAFTIEWGLGQLIPLDKQFTKILQVGLVGYDQWQVTGNSGTVAAKLVPAYSVHAIGCQANFLMPAKNVNLFFKFEPEYRALAHTLGRTLVFGATYKFRMPGASSPKN